MDELRYMGDGEVERGLYGPPLGKVQFVWPEQINVSLNPLNEQNYEAAINSAVDLVKSFCKCKARRRLGVRDKRPRTQEMRQVVGSKPMLQRQICFSRPGSSRSLIAPRVADPVQNAGPLPR